MEELNYQAVSELLFPDEKELNKTADERFSDEIRSQILNRKKESFKRLNPKTDAVSEAEEKFCEIADFIRGHIISVGKEQAVKDFQAGINFLHIDLKEFIKEDGDFGENTFRAFFDICNFYELEVIKESIRKGALSNAVIETTSDSAANTDFLVHNIQNNLKREGV